MKDVLSNLRRCIQTTLHSIVFRNLRSANRTSQAVHMAKFGKEKKLTSFPARYAHNYYAINACLTTTTSKHASVPQIHLPHTKEASEAENDVSSEHIQP